MMDDDAKLLQSIVPHVLASEVTDRFHKTRSLLTTLQAHINQRIHLEETLSSTIEKHTRETQKYPDIVETLRHECQSLVRLHMHLADKLTSEVHKPLHDFIESPSWKHQAHRIQKQLHTMADRMQNHHEQITRLMKNSGKKRDNNASKIETERISLIALQQQWQEDVVGLVREFEEIDKRARELVKDSVLRFEHYRTEFCKASINGTVQAKQMAVGLMNPPPIIDVLSQTTEFEREPEPKEAPLSQPSNSILGLFRTKTKRSNRSQRPSVGQVSQHTISTVNSTPQVPAAVLSTPSLNQPRSPGGNEFAEWIVTDKSQESTQSKSDGSLVHITRSPAKITPMPMEKPDGLFDDLDPSHTTADQPAADISTSVAADLDSAFTVPVATENDKEEEGEGEEEMEQSFRVKFSIRDQAIQDNPDESKAALNRVTTMLRAAPSIRRRSRRDVRSVYVPKQDEETANPPVSRRRAPPPPPPPPSAAAPAPEPEPAANETEQDIGESLGMSINVVETLNFDQPADKNEAVEHSVMGQIILHVQRQIKREDLEPLRIRIDKPTEGEQEWVSNPNVIKLENETSWYRFVNPEVFDQPTEGVARNLVIFKYQIKGQGDQRMLPVHIEQDDVDLTEGRLKQNTRLISNHEGRFGGVVLNGAALVVGVEGGEVEEQESEPPAVWDAETSSFRWELGDYRVEDKEDGLFRFEAQATEDRLKAEFGAIKFEAQDTRMVDVPIWVAREGKEAELRGTKIVRSGKCVFRFKK